MIYHLQMMLKVHPIGRHHVISKRPKWRRKFRPIGARFRLQNNNHYNSNKQKKSVQKRKEKIKKCKVQTKRRRRRRRKRRKKGKRAANNGKCEKSWLRCIIGGLLSVFIWARSCHWAKAWEFYGRRWSFLLRPFEHWMRLVSRTDSFPFVLDSIRRCYWWISITF